MEKLFNAIARKASALVGRAWVFMIALLIVVVWLVSGPIFHFSDTWQLIINTGTTIITFLIVFLIQNTQYRDMESLQIKLDELVRAHKLAHNSIIDLDKLTDAQLEALEKEYKRLSAKEGSPEIKK